MGNQCRKTTPVAHFRDSTMQFCPKPQDLRKSTRVCRVVIGWRPLWRIKFSLKRFSDPSRSSLRAQPLKNSAGRVPQAADGSCEKNHKSDRVGCRGLSEPGGIFSRLLTDAIPWLYPWLHPFLHPWLYPWLHPCLYPCLLRRAFIHQTAAEAHHPSHQSARLETQRRCAQHPHA